MTPGRRGDVGWLGVHPGRRNHDASSPARSRPLELSVRRTSRPPGLIFQTVWGLLTRETSPKQLMGPVAIAQLSGESAQLGWIPLLQPDGVDQPQPGPAEPAADSDSRRRPHPHHGARRGRAPRLQLRVKEKMLLAGFVVLMMLMVTVIYNDLARISWIRTSCLGADFATRAPLRRFAVSSTICTAGLPGTRVRDSRSHRSRRGTGPDRQQPRTTSPALRFSGCRTASTTRRETCRSCARATRRWPPSSSASSTTPRRSDLSARSSYGRNEAGHPQRVPRPARSDRDDPHARAR